MTVDRISSDKARLNLRTLLDSAMMGKTTIIERYGAPVAVLVNYQEWLAWQEQQKAQQRKAE